MFLLEQSLCDCRTSFFPKNANISFANISVHYESSFLQYVHKINNQLLITANSKDINAEFYITNSALASRYHGPVAYRYGRRPAT